jgi:S-DNA-T family DNA segregation ATPase FtsK/SpoIIIE
MKARSATKSVLSAYKPELVGLSLMAGASFVLVSLVSYHPHDSSLFYYSSMAHPIRNMGGMLGAQCAALLMYLFGASSIFIPCLMGFLAYLSFKREAFKKNYDRIAGAILFIVVCSMLSNIYHVDFLSSPYPGGLCGRLLHKQLVALLGIWAVAAVHGALLIALIMLSRFSFIHLIMYGYRALRAVMNRKFLVPLYKTSKRVMSHIMHPIILFVNFTKKLIAGSVVDDYRAVDFESLLRETARGLDPDPFLMGVDGLAQAATKAPHKAATIQAAVVQEDAPIKAAPAPEIKQQRPQESTNSSFEVPNLNLFTTVEHESQGAKITKELEARAKILEEKLECFGIEGAVTAIKRGPVVTLFEYQPAIDTKVSKIVALEDDLAMALQALSIRIIAPIPGRSVVGFEVANAQRKNVHLSNVIRSHQYKDFAGALPLILGEDTTGNNVIVDLAAMPHFLIAGSTGSGKSVALNAMLMSLLCKHTPSQMKLILIDPKRLEFAAYADIPHLIFPIITDARRATLALRFVVQHMEERYSTMAACGARNFADYNALVGVHEKITLAMPYMVVIIDELADLMMTASKEIEDLITRITQMARAAGIHLMVATQRPSVDVITGLIKVNFPSRIAFRVTSKIDSRTILDCAGADKLLGRGDMLFLDAQGGSLRRVHGAYVSDKEISAVVAHLRSQQSPSYLDLNEEIVATANFNADDADDAIYRDVLAFIKEVDEVSISLVQRRFRIGFNRSARIIERLESQGLIMSSDGGKTRKVMR